MALSQYLHLVSFRSRLRLVITNRLILLSEGIGWVFRGYRYGFAARAFCYRVLVSTRISSAARFFFSAARKMLDGDMQYLHHFGTFLLGSSSYKVVACWRKDND